MTQDSLRGILASNLIKLIRHATPEGDRPSIRAWAMARGLDVRLIDRLTKAEHSVTLDKIEEIASACGLQPWHLLLPDLDPRAKPDAPISAEDKALITRLRSLLVSPPP